jgi:hypothetical protein
MKTVKRGRARKAAAAARPASIRKGQPRAEHPCCPPVSDLVTLEMGNPVVPEDPLFRGLYRVHPDGSVHPNEQNEPYGFIIPKGMVLVVTDVAYHSAFTQPRPPGTLTELRFGIVTVTPNSVGQRIIFTTSSLMAINDGSIGGNVALRTGFAVGHGHYLSVNFLDFELVSTYLYVYGYLAPA